MRVLKEKGDKLVCDLIEGSPRDREYGYAPTSWRKILNGATFNSGSCINVATYLADETDCSTRHEQLFQTPKGRFILVGDGECCSPWSKQLPGCSSYVLGHAFVPLTTEETKRWLEARGLDDEREEIFGGEYEEATQILLKLPPTLVNRVAMAAKEETLSIQAWIFNAIEEHARRLR